MYSEYQCNFSTFISGFLYFFIFTKKNIFHERRKRRRRRNIFCITDKRRLRPQAPAARCPFRWCYRSATCFLLSRRRRSALLPHNRVVIIIPERREKTPRWPCKVHIPSRIIISAPQHFDRTSNKAFQTSIEKFR